ncbi:hypothetical protein [Burkholderia ubonensis]|nr:hypothetical protein [Burkholderia ubonensis]
MNGDWGPFDVAFLVAGALGGLVMILVGLFGSDLARRTAGRTPRHPMRPR